MGKLNSELAVCKIRDVVAISVTLGRFTFPFVVILVIPVSLVEPNVIVAAVPPKVKNRSFVIVPPVEC
jgi:hypothetical protein